MFFITYANGLAILSRFEDAVKLLEEYEAIFPGDLMVNYRFGVMNEHKKNNPNAEKEYRQTLEVNDKDFVARNSYAQTLRRLGLTEQASTELERLERERVEFDKITSLRDKVNQNPNDTESKIAIGKILFDYESERFGLFWIRSALASDPNCQAAHEFLADYYENKADENELYRSKAAYHRSRIVQALPHTVDTN